MQNYDEDKNIAAVVAWLEAYRTGKRCKQLGNIAIAAIRRTSKREINLNLAARLNALTGPGLLKLTRIANQMALTRSALSSFKAGKMRLSLSNVQKLDEILSRYEKGIQHEKDKNL